MSLSMVALCLALYFRHALTAWALHKALASVSLSPWQVWRPS